MPSDAFKLYNYAIWAPDVPNSEDLRVEHYPAHTEYGKPLLENGVKRMGGKLIDEADKDMPFSQSRARASFVIYMVENLEAAWKLVKEDPFYKEGVWQKDRIVVLPFEAATKLYGDA